MLKAASPVYVQTVLVQWCVCYGNVVEFGDMFNVVRSEEHTSELQSRETTSYAVFCLKKKT